MPVLGRLPLGRLSPQHVRAFRKAKLEAGFSATTVKHMRDTLRCALNVALGDGLIVRNAAALVEPPRTKNPFKPRFLTPEEGRPFLRAIAGHRLEALFSVGICLGLREREVLGLL